MEAVVFLRHHGRADEASTHNAEGRRKGLRRTIRGAVLGMGALVVLSATGLMSASAGPNDLGASDHEGQRKVAGVLDGYTDGNTSTYTELDPINFRFDLDADDAGSGQMQIRFTDGQADCEFFDGTFNLGTHDGSAPAVVTVSGATPTVAIVGAPTLDVDD